MRSAIKINHLITLIMFWCTICEISAQPWFEVQTENFVEGSTFSGSPLAAVDVNGDYLDDIIFLERGVELNIGLQDPFTGLFKKEFLGIVNPEPQWSMAVADIDKNGLRDIVVAGPYDDISVFYQEKDSFRRVNHIIPIIYSQSMNLVDIDNDGWLDLFLCNDIRYNQVYWNRKGELVKDTTLLFRDLPEDVSSGNYGSEWGDVDGDGDLDLFLAKCNASATSPSDLRRVNRLYIQNENGGFVEEAKLRGLASGAQSWTGHLFDMDNDADLDILVTNHDQDAELMENQGDGTFQPISPASGLRINGPVIQGIAFDFNLDGQKDIVAGGFPDFLYEKRNGSRYRRIDESLGLYDLISMAVGDLNNDNRYDIWANVGNLINLSSQMNDRILYNQTPFKDHIVIYLAGTESNRDGIGSKVSVHSKGQTQFYQVKSGESYGIQNSYKIIAAIPSEGIDSIIVQWPSGQRQVSYRHESNGHHLFWENVNVHIEDKNDLPGEYYICQDEKKWLVAPQGYKSYEWSDGTMNDSLLVEKRGIYQCKIALDTTTSIWLPPTIVHEDIISTGRIKVVNGTSPTCVSNPIGIQYFPSRVDQVWQWSDGQYNSNRILDSSGLYQVQIEGRCGSRIVDSIMVHVSAPRMLEIQEDSITSLDIGTLVGLSSGQKTLWYKSENDNSPFFEGDTLRVGPGIEMDTMFWVEPVEVTSFGVERGGKRQVDAMNPFHKDNLNGTLIFQVDVPTVIESVDVRTDTASVRAIRILDKNLAVVTEVDMTMDTGWNTVRLDVALDPEWGPYRITTNPDVNIAHLGHRSPRLMSCDKSILYPYALGNVGQIIRSQFGYNKYNYFYNWKVRRADLECVGDRQPVFLWKKRTNTTALQKEQKDVSIYPNPNWGEFQIEFHEKIFLEKQKEVKIYDLFGRNIEFKTKHRDQHGVLIQLDQKGTYLLKVGQWHQMLQVQ